MQGQQTILIVDDEEPIRTFLRIALTREGYTTLEAESGLQALEMVRDYKPDAVLLDMVLPDASGLEVTRHVRAWSWIPILFLSVRDEERTKVEALDAGADDYLSKPFGTDELLARLRAALRRKNVVPKSGMLQCGELCLDQDTRQVLFANQKIALSPNEFGILQVLMRSPGRLVTHRQILAEVWGPHYAEETHMLRVNIFNLRKKLETAAGGARLVVNEPGVGYRLLGPDSSGEE